MTPGIPDEDAHADSRITNIHLSISCPYRQKLTFGEGDPPAAPV
jgi:hypothetical protein